MAQVYTKGKSSALGADFITPRPASSKSMDDGRFLSAVDKKNKRLEEEAREKQSLAEHLAAATVQMTSGVRESMVASSKMLIAGEQLSEITEVTNYAAEEAKDIAVRCDKRAQVIAESGTAITLATSKLNESFLQNVNSINIANEGVGSAASVNMEAVRSSEDLIRQGDEIGNIVQSVVGIADQTNLLALNAAIEAARAGEHGRGFAVVADEVRNLAANAESAAREISDVVTSIQAEIKEVSAEIEQAGKAAMEEVDRAKRVVDSLGSLQRGATEIGLAAQICNEEAVKQLQVISEFLSGAEQIASASNEVAAATNEAVNSLKEQNKALEEIQVASNELAVISEAIKEGQTSDEAADEVASSAEELAATVQETNNAAQQILGALQEIKSGAEQSVKISAQNKKKVVQTKESTVRVKEAAVRVKSVINEILSSYTNSVEEFSSVVNKVTEVSASNIASARKLAGLGNRAKKIDKIVDAIVNIAIQTNLLALNGAIEAARAGEYGKGFSVVAADVKNLANESSQSAEKIKDLVRNVQDQIAIVGTAVDKAGREAEVSTERGRTILRDTETVLNMANAVIKEADKVISYCEEQLKDSEQGIEASEKVRQEAEKAMAEAEKSNSAAGEQARSIEELAKTVEEIAHFAEELRAY